MHIFAFALTLFPYEGPSRTIAVIISFLVNGSFYALNFKEKTYLAGLGFCTFFTFLISISIIINVQIDSVFTAGVFGALLSLNILLAGMLINTRSIIVTTSFNLILLTGIVLFFSPEIWQQLIPLATFHILLATISWIYQTSLNKAVIDLQVSQEEQHRITLEQRIQQRDVEIAQRLQEQLYPNPAEVPHSLKVASLLEAARETSGDFYDWLCISPQTWGLVIADVSGKSLSAAMVMTMSRTIIRTQIRSGYSPAQVLANTNETMLKDAKIDELVTMGYGVLNTETLTFTYANAGHPHPILLRAGQTSYLEAYGLPIRGMEGFPYEETEFQLQVGDVLIFYTDGTYETRNRAGKYLSFDGLMDIIEASEPEPDSLVQHIKNEVDRYRADLPPEDDLTVIAVKIMPPTED